MTKYTRWILRLVFPLLYAYVTWMWRYARKPERYSAEKRYRKVRKFIFRLVKVLRLEITIENMPEIKPDQTYYYVANHTSLVDAIVAVAVIPEPVRFIVKDEVKRAPFVRKFVEVLDCVYLERDNLKQEIRAMQVTRRSLHAKQASWMVFPEGTRNRDYHNEINEYKAGAFKAPLQTGTKIVPFVTWGSQVVLPLKNRAKRYPIFVKFLEPVTYTRESNVTTQQIAEQIYRDSNATMNVLRDKYRDVVKLNKHGVDFITQK